MKYFKTKANRTSPRYEITAGIFEKVTDHKYPFEQRNADQTISQFGICPSCLNPIQLIGISKEIKRTPYGKHTGKNIKGLANWQQIKYKYCPYAARNDRREINDEEFLPEITEDITELYNLLKNQFDRVVYVISKELDIRCSAAFWKGVLQQYLANTAYCYPWLTEANLPYIFAYIGMRHRNVYGQEFLVGSDLYNALKKHKYVNFCSSNDNSNKYVHLTSINGFLNLEFRFTGHTQKAVNGETLKESMVFCVDDLTSGDTVFKKRIEFSENYFMNIINKSGNESKRQKVLLGISEELMPPLQVV